MPLEHRIKLKIKQLIKAKKMKKSHLSVMIGYNKGFISTVLGDSKKFFNLEHIEKICTALDYPVARLFENSINSQEEQTLPAPGQEEVLLEIFRGLSPEYKLDVISFAGKFRLAEAIPSRTSKKASAA